MGNHTVHHESWYWEAGVEALDFTDYIQVNRTLIRKLGLHEAILIGELSAGLGSARGSWLMAGSTRRLRTSSTRLASARTSSGLHLRIWRTWAS